MVCQQSSVAPNAIPAHSGLRPLFVLLNVWSILSFNFRGTSWRSLLGLEKEHAVFSRYRVIRQAERSYL
jgi:hypothetical protein